MLPNQLTDKLSPLSRVLAKVIIVQPVRLSSVMKQRFITVFIGAHSLSLSRAKLNNSTPYILLLMSVLISFFLLCQCVPSCLITVGFVLDLCACNIPLSITPPFFMFLVMLNVEYKFWNSSLHIFFFVLYILHFRYKYSAQLPIIKCH